MKRRQVTSGARYVLLLLAAKPPFLTCEEADGVWECKDNFPWSECQRFLPSERAALSVFLKELATTPLPKLGDLVGYGIVMSGGSMHVLQALANLKVIREYFGSTLPVEYWHAYELEEVHCEALRSLGARCRALRIPGVYPQYQTVLPAIMLSDFRHVFWIDTDITPLVKPELLFHTEEYARFGALFWPDHWGSDCPVWGGTARQRHVVWHLLDMPYNASDPKCVAEHETGHFLFDKERHWRSLCLANYLANRDFFQRVLHGYKDVFRLSMLKLNAPNWLSPLRPGVLGFSYRDGQFIGPHMVHFWPSGGQLGLGGYGRPVPIYVHQRKRPCRSWHEILTFPIPLGGCAPFRINDEAFALDPKTMRKWGLREAHQELYGVLQQVDAVWQAGWYDYRTAFIRAEEGRLSVEALATSLGAERAPRCSRQDLVDILAAERFGLRPAGNCSWLEGELEAEGLLGTWSLEFSNGFGPLAYHIDEDGSVRADGVYDGTGIGSLCRFQSLYDRRNSARQYSADSARQLAAAASKGHVYVISGIHRAGKWETLRLAEHGRFEMVHRVGLEFVCCTVIGRRQKTRSMSTGNHIIAAIATGASQPGSQPIMTLHPSRWKARGHHALPLVGSQVQIE